MNIAFCYENVLPHRGGCETYIASLARRLAMDGHEIHLYARCWDPSALPAELNYHRVLAPRFPRFFRPWYFSSACRRELRDADHDATIGFDKITGPDVLYPQGGVYAASVDFNLLKHRGALTRRVLRALKGLDVAHLSFLALERAQFRDRRPLVVAISDMVRRHLESWYGIEPANLRVLPIAATPDRFAQCDRPRRRHAARKRWGLAPTA